MDWFKGKSIVVPIDYSDGSKHAVLFAESVAGDPSTIHAVHVIPQINDPHVSYVGSILDDKAQSRTHQALEDWLAAIPSKITSAHVKVGDPGFTIANYASEFENGVIVISSQGLSGISRVLIGSVTERVVRLAHCPVMVLKPGREEQA